MASPGPAEEKRRPTGNPISDLIRAIYALLSDPSFAIFVIITLAVASILAMVIVDQRPTPNDIARMPTDRLDDPWIWFLINIAPEHPYHTAAFRTLMALRAGRLIDALSARQMERDPFTRWAIEHGSYVFGVERPYDYFRRMQKFTTRGISHRVEQDFLLHSPAFTPFTGQIYFSSISYSLFFCNRLINDEDIGIDVIGDSCPRSICGSGLIDAVAVMLDLGLIEQTGRMVEKSN